MILTSGTYMLQSIQSLDSCHGCICLAVDHVGIPATSEHYVWYIYLYIWLSELFIVNRLNDWKKNRLNMISKTELCDVR